MPDFTPFDVSVGTKSSPEYTSFVFSNGNTRGSDSPPGCPADAFATLFYTPVLRPSYLPGQARGRATALNKAAINNPFLQTGTPAVPQMS